MRDQFTCMLSRTKQLKMFDWNPSWSFKPSFQLTCKHLYAPHCHIRAIQSTLICNSGSEVKFCTRARARIRAEVATTQEITRLHSYAIHCNKRTPRKHKHKENTLGQTGKISSSFAPSLSRSLSSLFFLPEKAPCWAKRWSWHAVLPKAT